MMDSDARSRGERWENEGGEPVFNQLSILVHHEAGICGETQVLQ